MRREVPVRLYLTAALVFLLLLAAGITVKDDRRAAQLLATGTALAKPLFAASSRVVRAIRGEEAYVSGLFARAGEVVRLRRDAAELRSARAQNSYLESEVRRLERLLRLTRLPAVRGRWISADVIGRSPSTWFSTAIIDRGTADGVRRGDAVLSGRGLVGVVLSTSPTTSVVLLITDPESGVPIMDAASGDAGLLNGQGPDALPLAQFFSGTASVRPGDVIVTSGLGGTIPRGIVVGQVAGIRTSSFGLVSSATVRPLADLDALGPVLVVTGR